MGISDFFPKTEIFLEKYGDFGLTKYQSDDLGLRAITLYYRIYYLFRIFVTLRYSIPIAQYVEKGRNRHRVTSALPPEPRKTPQTAGEAFVKGFFWKKLII